MNAAASPVDREATARPLSDEPSAQQIPNPSANPAANEFVLKVRTNGKLWDGSQLYTAATEKAGFGHATLPMALLGDLKRVPIAVMRKNGFLEAVGELSELSIVMDLDKHSAQWNAFERMVRAAETLANELGGIVTFSDGSTITPEKMEAEKERVTAVHSARREPERQSHTSVAPDGTRVVRDESFPCITQTISKRGKWLGYKFFDVKPMGKERGRAAGLRLAKALLDGISERNRPPALRLDCMLLAALSAAEPGAKNVSRDDGASTLNVAAGLIEALEDMVKFYAEHATNYGPYLEHRAAACDQYATSEENRIAAYKADFVSRMRAAREAKSAKILAARQAALPPKASTVARRVPVPRAQEPALA